MIWQTGFIFRTHTYRNMLKNILELTFMEYLNNVRLFHAVDELLYTKKNITRIALDNGFPTSAAFTKAFRDIYREAPSEYREEDAEEGVLRRHRPNFRKESGHRL